MDLQWARMETVLRIESAADENPELAIWRRPQDASGHSRAAQLLAERHCPDREFFLGRREDFRSGGLAADVGRAWQCPAADDQPRDGVVRSQGPARSRPVAGDAHGATGL